MRFFCFLFQNPFSGLIELCVSSNSVASKAMVFSSSRVWMWVGVMKNWFFQTVVLEKALESPLDCKEIKPVNPKGNQPWIFIGKTDAEAEVPILWPFDAKSLIVGKDPDAGKDWRQEEKGVTEDEITSWMASLTQWTWVWADSRRYWRTGKLGMLWFIGSQSDMT